MLHGPDAARRVEALLWREGDNRVFPEDLTGSRLYNFWTWTHGSYTISGDATQAQDRKLNSD